MCDWRDALTRGQVIPAHPLALTAARKLDERRQRALSRYYLAAGAGGLAVGVHTTQFEIRDVGLFRPVLELAATVMCEEAPADCVRIAGAIGPTAQAVKEAELARELGYDAVLLSLAALRRNRQCRRDQGRPFQSLSDHRCVARAGAFRQRRRNSALHR